MNWRPSGPEISSELDSNLHFGPFSVFSSSPFFRTSSTSAKPTNSLRTMTVGTTCLRSARTSRPWVFKPNPWSAVHSFLPTLKILEIQPSSSLELNGTRSPSRNLMRMDSSPSLLKTDTLLPKSMRLSNSSTMVEQSSFWKTLAMLEALVKPTVYAIQATSSTIQTTFLNWITTTSGCVSKQARVE